MTNRDATNLTISKLYHTLTEKGVPSSLGSEMTWRGEGREGKGGTPLEPWCNRFGWAGVEEARPVS